MQSIVSDLSPMAWLVAAQFLLYATGWCLFALALRENRVALLHWGVFMLLLGLGFLLASQRGEPRTWGPYLGANLCFLLGFVVLWRGMDCSWIAARRTASTWPARWCSRSHTEPSACKRSTATGA